MLYVFSGLPVYIRSRQCKQRVDEAGYPVNQERPLKPQPNPHLPGSAVYRKHRLKGHGRRLLSRHTKTSRIRVGSWVLVCNDVELYSS